MHRRSHGRDMAETWTLLLWLCLVLVVYAIGVRVSDLPTNLPGFLSFVVLSFLGILFGRYVGRRLFDQG